MLARFHQIQGRRTPTLYEKPRRRPPAPRYIPVALACGGITAADYRQTATNGQPAAEAATLAGRGITAADYRLVNFAQAAEPAAATSAGVTAANYFLCVIVGAPVAPAANAVSLGITAANYASV